MTELLTAAQMRAIEQAAIASGAVTGLELMERAGRGVVEAIFAEWPELEGAGLAETDRGPAPGPPGYLEQEEKRRAVVLCGPGNNGGDGFVVARLLLERGWAVEVFLYGDADRLPPDARVNYERWCEMGEVFGPPARDGDEKIALHLLATTPTSNPVLFVDALFGTGLSRPVADKMTGFEIVLCNLIPNAGARRVAIDIPSGLCADSGKALGQAFLSDLCVSFHRQKLGHVLEDGPHHCGKVVVKDIGLSGFFLGEILPPEAPSVVTQTDGSELVQALSKQSAHKYDHGHALILTGGSGKTGAARLAARAALRIGAGLVTLGAPGSAQMEVASQITALMLTRVNDAEGLGTVLEDKRLTSLCLGPGLGLDRARDLVPVALESERGVVLDADALSAFEGDPQALFDLLHPNCAITPHGGEFARLFPDIAQRLREAPTRGPAYSKVDATRDAARRAGCTVLFKGPDTVIADPHGHCSVHSAQYDRAAPWLATAGSGDVLAGFITGLMARNMDPMMACEAAAWLHVDCARSFGPGLIAEDLPEELPKVLRALGA